MTNPNTILDSFQEVIDKAGPTLAMITYLPTQKIKDVVEAGDEIFIPMVVATRGADAAKLCQTTMEMLKLLLFFQEEVKSRIPDIDFIEKVWPGFKKDLEERENKGRVSQDGR